MIFYVYLDPQIISTALSKGDLGVQALTAILHALSQNCFLAEFNNYSYTQEEIGKQLKNIVGDFDVLALKKVLKHFVKEHLFIECLEYDYSGISEVEMAQKQAATAFLDLLVLSDEADIYAGVPVEVTKLGDYQTSRFEPMRSKIAVKGVTLPDASLHEDEFLERYFRKSLQYARTVEIFDYLSGEQYKSNYEYTLKKFFDWLETVNKQDLTIIYHCGYPNPEGSLFERDEFDGLNPDEIELRKREKLLQKFSGYYRKSPIKVLLYDEKFSHDRYIITDQIAFSIGIGMDFLHHTGANKSTIRDISINFKDIRELKSLLLTEN